MSIRDWRQEIVISPPRCGRIGNVDFESRKTRVLAHEGPHPLPKGWNYSHGIRVGDLLFVAGQSAFNEDLEIVGPGDPLAQARQTWKNIQKITEAAGGKVTDVVSVTTYLDDIDLIDTVQAVRPEFFPEGDYPASTDIIVAQPSMPGIYFEMVAIAAIGSS